MEKKSYETFLIRRHFGMVGQSCRFRFGAGSRAVHKREDGSQRWTVDAREALPADSRM
jgi:hypothetical protein